MMKCNLNELDERCPRRVLKDLAQKKLGPIVLRIIKKFFGCIALHNFSVIHKEHPVGHAFCKSHFMGHHDHGHAF